MLLIVVKFIINLVLLIFTSSKASTNAGIVPFKWVFRVRCNLKRKDVEEYQ